MNTTELGVQNVQGDQGMLTAGVDVGSAVVKIALVETDGAGGERLVAGRAERIRRRWLREHTDAPPECRQTASTRYAQV